MKGNDDKRQHVIPFMKCFTGLVGAFTPEEVIFMLYMADRTRLREKGYDTLRSKRYYMENMEMGSRIFDKCVEKTTRMGLLERVPVSGMAHGFLQPACRDIGGTWKSFFYQGILSSDVRCGKKDRGIRL